MCLLEITSIYLFIYIFIHELFESCRTRNDESFSSRILLHYNLLHINYALLNSSSSRVQTYQVMFIACNATFNFTNSSSMKTFIENIANTFRHVLEYLQRRNILHQRNHQNLHQSRSQCLHLLHLETSLQNVHQASSLNLLQKRCSQ